MTTAKVLSACAILLVVASSSAFACNRDQFEFHHRCYNALGDIPGRTRVQFGEKTRPHRAGKIAVPARVKRKSHRMQSRV